jgi:hypothetical protein
MTEMFVLKPLEQSVIEREVAEITEIEEVSFLHVLRFMFAGASQYWFAGHPQS